MASALGVVGQLLVEMGDVPVRVEADGDTIAVKLPSYRAGLALLRVGPGGRGRREMLGRVHRGLVDAGLRVLIQVGPRTVGRLGVGARAGLASRLLGVGPLQLGAGRADPGRREG